MNSKYFYYLMCGLVGLAALAVLGGAVLGDRMLQKQTNELVALKLESKVLDEQQASLIQANKDITKYAELEKIAKTIVPQEKDQARVVRQIVSYATETKIAIQNITFPTSTLGQTQPKASTGSGGSSTPVPSAKTPATQLKAVEGLAGVYQMEITVQSDIAKPITYPQLVDFLSKLEKNRRTAQVSGITVTPNAKNRSQITFSLTVNVYVKP